MHTLNQYLHDYKIRKEWRPSTNKKKKINLWLSSHWKKPGDYIFGLPGKTKKLLQSCMHKQAWKKLFMLLPIAQLTMTPIYRESRKINLNKITWWEGRGNPLVRTHGVELSYTYTLLDLFNPVSREKCSSDPNII